MLTMSDRTCKNCPVPNCGAKYLVKLSNHLAQVHDLSPQERRPFLQEAKVQKYKVIKKYNDSVWFIPPEKKVYKSV